jgi:NTP pyrophosphatase (non-canonical NTP hydrolase)
MTDLITLPRATVQQALEALENGSPDQYPEDAGVFYDAKDALRAALEQPVQEPAFDALVAISLLTHLGGEVADYEDVVEAVRRLHSVNTELGAALRRLISYCNTLENRLMEADGEHPAMQEAKEAYAKAEGKV